VHALEIRLAVVPHLLVTNGGVLATGSPPVYEAQNADASLEVWLKAMRQLSPAHLGATRHQQALLNLASEEEQALSMPEGVLATAVVR
jgi:hypothetical protein